MPEYTPEETQATIKKAVALGNKLNAVIGAEPKLTMGVAISALAYLLAIRATDQTHAEKLAKDVATAVMALYGMRTQ